MRNNIEAHYDEEKDKYLMKDEKYVAHLTSILLKYMHQGEGWNKIDTVKEYIKKENIMEISYELLSGKIYQLYKYLLVKSLCTNYYT